MCGQYSSCRWNSTTSKCATYTTGTCEVQTNQVSCAAIGCFYDTYLQQCYVSLSEVVSINPCSTWSSFPLPNTACAFHGCSLNAAGTVCGAPSTGGSNVTNYALNIYASFVNPNVGLNSFAFNVQVWLANQLLYDPPVNQIIQVGGGQTGYPAAIVAGPCNNLASFNYSSPPPAYVGVTDPVGLQNYFNAWVSTYHNYSFPKSNTTFGLPLYQILGSLNIQNSSIDDSVSLDASGNYVIHQLSFNYNSIVSQCSALGATQLYTPTNIYTTLPISVIQRDSNNNFAAVSSTFYIQQSTTGAVLSVSSSSRFQPEVFLNQLTSLTSACPPGQAQLNEVYLLEVANVFASGVFVGPRNASDILFTSPVVNNSLANCYGDSLVSMQRLSCFNSVCYTQVTLQTRCRPITADGNAFNNCSNANAADRISDMGGNTAYPTALNNQHTFWVNNWACPTVSNASNGWANCTLANESPFGFPDQMPVTITVYLYPLTSISVNFDVYAGLLNSPYTTDLSQIETLSQGPNLVSSTQDLFNTQLSWNGKNSTRVHSYNTTNNKSSHKTNNVLALCACARVRV